MCEFLNLVVKEQALLTFTDFLYSYSYKQGFGHQCYCLLEFRRYGTSMHYMQFKNKCNKKRIYLKSRLRNGWIKCSAKWCSSSFKISTATVKKWQLSNYVLIYSWRRCKQQLSERKFNFALKSVNLRVQFSFQRNFQKLDHKDIND